MLKPRKLQHVSTCWFKLADFLQFDRLKSMKLRSGMKETKVKSWCLLFLSSFFDKGRIIQLDDGWRMKRRHWIAGNKRKMKLLEKCSPALDLWRLDGSSVHLLAADFSGKRVILWLRIWSSAQWNYCSVFLKWKIPWISCWIWCSKSETRGVRTSWRPGLIENQGKHGRMIVWKLLNKIAVGSQVKRKSLPISIRV